MADSDSQAQGESMAFGRFCLHPAKRLLTRDGAPVEIGGRSFDLLMALAEQPGRVLSKRELLKRVWPDVVVEDGSLRFHMAGLRKLLGEGAGSDKDADGPRFIATQVGVGYAFVAPVLRTGAPAAEAATPAPEMPTGFATNIPPRCRIWSGASKTSSCCWPAWSTPRCSRSPGLRASARPRC
ncbi:transcriptional regulator [Novosphingobium sp. 9]|uniref:winged helix-turn-helix domain-containing protein n=1 Tax=Novosphingobium sp. 9 TaxID=2025349 RepID=UPI0021B50E4F|nr:winged helix-turn-helix domain-containing protein [Novosphingobium sp. 9]